MGISLRILVLATSSFPVIFEKIKFVLQRCGMYLEILHVTPSYPQRPWE